MPRHAAPALAIIGFLTACADAGTAPQPAPQYLVTPGAQWSGGEVQVRSEAFVGRTTLPIIVAGPDTLSLTRIDDSTLSVRLPVRASSQVELRVLRGTSHDIAGTVQVYGEAGRTDVSPSPAAGIALGWRGADPLFVGLNDQNRTVVVVDAAAGTSWLVPGLRTPDLYGPGIGQRPDQFLLMDATDTFRVWQLWPTVAPVEATPWGGGPARMMAQMSDSTWVFSLGLWTTSLGPKGSKSFNTYDVWNYFRSARGDRFAMALAQLPSSGAPVFDAASGDTAFTVPGVSYVEWADFSPNGAELYLLGARTFPGDSIVVVNAATGASLRSTRLPTAMAGLSLAVDPTQDLLYVQGYRQCGPTVLVYQASTLQRVGELHGGGAVEACDNFQWPGQMVADRTRGKLYVLWIGQTAAPLWSFDLLP